MEQRRDNYQRKVSAMRRMVLALERQTQAESVAEKELVERWVLLWGVVAGIRRFPLEKPGRTVYKTRRIIRPRRKPLSTW
jgi:hypothetical protein